MDKLQSLNHRTIPILISSLFLLLGMGLSNTAASEPITPLAHQQLAYFIGFHNGQGVYYRHHGYRHYNAYYGNRYRYHNNYWRNWGYHGGCRKSCLINRNGAVIRCVTRCP